MKPFLVLLACALVWLCACGPRPGSSGEGRGILVIAIDGLRADHLGIGGNDRPATPVLDGLARQGVWFANARSTSPDLEGAHASLLTGCDPLLSSRLGKGGEASSALSRWLIPAAVPSLAEELLRGGYDTAAFADHPSIDETLGYGRGFREFRALREEDAALAGEGFEAASTKFERWLGDRSRSQDWFAYIEAHDLVRQWSRRQEDPRWSRLYEPRPELAMVPPLGAFRRGFYALSRDRWGGGPITLGEYEARYDGELTNLDAKIGRVLERLRATGRLRNTTVIVVGTHGMSFGEGGLYLDAGKLDDADLHVPLIVRQPLGSGAMTQVHSHVVSLVDVAPTVLELAGIPRPATMHGVSLMPTLKGDAAPLRRYAFAAGGLLQGRSVIDDRYCYEEDRANAIGDRLVRETWLGTTAVSGGEQRTHLHDRGLSRAMGHLASTEDGEVQGRLRTVLRQWMDRVEAARAALQSPGADARGALESLVDPARSAWATESAR